MISRVQRVVVWAVILLVFAVVVVPLSAQETKASEYSDRLDQVEALILSGQEFTEAQIEELRKSCFDLEDEGYADLALRCRFLLFLAGSQTSVPATESAVLDEAILADETVGEKRANWTRTMMITGAGFLGAFNLFAITSDIFYGDYLKIGTEGGVTASDLQKAAYLQATWKAMDIAAWASLGASGVSFLVGAITAVNNPSSLGEIPPPPVSVSEDPAYERLRLQQERADLTKKIERRSSTREALRIGGIVGTGAAIGSFGTAIVYVWLSDIDWENGAFVDAEKKERTAGALAITSVNLLGTSLIALLAKPNVSKFEDQLEILDARLTELAGQ